MEELNQVSNPSPASPTPPPTPSMQLAPPKKSNLPLILMTLLFLLAASAAAYFYFFPRTPAAMKQENPVPSAVIVPSSEPMSNWKTYKSDVQHISFRYPPEWQIQIQNGDNVDGEFLNSSITLTKNYQTVKMLLNVKGIGGLGKSYQGKPFILDGNSMYEYQEKIGDNVVVGITDRLESSLGFFQINNKTYAITLTVPSNNFSDEMVTTFNQILSTFQFTASLSEEDQVRLFAEQFASAYQKDQWPEIKSLLTKSAIDELNASGMDYSQSQPYLEDYQILSIKKSGEAYIATIRFLKNGQAFKNPAGDPQIRIIKEDGQWRSMTWYLYQ